MAKTTDAKAAPAPVGPDYFSQSRRPLASLFFAGPLLVIYETGLICLGPSAPRNGADALLRKSLTTLGFRQQLDYFLLPLVTVGILLGWHYVSRQPWRVSRKVLFGMACESFGLSAALWLSWSLCQLFWQAVSRSVPMEVNTRNVANWLGTINSYFGAGIYEELLFRMILLNVCAGLLLWLRIGPRASTVGGIVISSVLFSAAHYGRFGDDWNWLTFCFRFLAGAFFAVLYLYRGFGIAAGTHALYDVLVQLSIARVA